MSRFSEEYDWTPQVEKTRIHINILLQNYNPSGSYFWQYLESELFTLAEGIAEQVKADWFADNVEQGDQAFRSLDENFLIALQAVKDGVLVHPKQEGEEHE